MLNSIILKLQVIYSLSKSQGNYYSGSCEAGALKICQDTEHQNVGKQHILPNHCNFYAASSYKEKSHSFMLLIVKYIK